MILIKRILRRIKRGHIFIYFKTSETMQYWEASYFQGGDGHALGRYETDETLIEALHQVA
jgi:hypothetical protein